MGLKKKFFLLISIKYIDFRLLQLPAFLKTPALQNIWLVLKFFADMFTAFSELFVQELKKNSFWVHAQLSSFPSPPL